MNPPQFCTLTGIRKRQQSLELPWKNCQVAQAESWRISPGRGSEVSFSDSHTGAWVPQRFICRRPQTETVITFIEVVIIPCTCTGGVYYITCLNDRYLMVLFGSEGSSQCKDLKECEHRHLCDRTCLSFWPFYLNTGGRHLCWLVVDPEPVPAWWQRVVTDQILDGGVLDFSGVKVDTSIRIAQTPMTSRVTLWSWEQERQRCQTENSWKGRGKDAKIMWKRRLRFGIFNLFICLKQKATESVCYENLKLMMFSWKLASAGKSSVFKP